MNTFFLFHIRAATTFSNIHRGTYMCQYVVTALNNCVFESNKQKFLVSLLRSLTLRDCVDCSALKWRRSSNRQPVKRTHNSSRHTVSSYSMLYLIVQFRNTSLKLQLIYFCFEKSIYIFSVNNNVNYIIKYLQLNSHFFFLNYNAMLQ